MNLSVEAVRRTAENLFGIREFRPYQEEIIQSILEGKNTLAVLPTGGGKSLTYQIPAMMLDGLTLVVTPLLSLMKDQLRVLRERGVPGCGSLSSANTSSEIRQVLDNLNELKIIYVTPERLESPAFLQRLRDTCVKIPLVVIDEAHCVSLWGNTFRPSYRRIGKFLGQFPSAVAAAFTGTASDTLRKDICQSLLRKDWNVIAAGMARDNLSISVKYVDDKVRYLTENLHAGENTIIYTGSKTVCGRLNHILTARGLKSTVYHAGLPREEREESQKLFMDGEKNIVVATSAFGMGIDKKDVRRVYHYHVPGEMEEYYQEIGRAGRDGKPSEAVMLLGPDDGQEMKTNLEKRYPGWKRIRKLLHGRSCLPSDETTREGLVSMLSLEDFSEITRLKREYLRLRKNIFRKAIEMREYVAASGCRSRMILEHFGEKPGNCGRCDYCRAEAAGFHAEEWTDAEIRVIAALRGTRGKVSIQDLREVLAGLRYRDGLKSGFGSLRGTDWKVFGGIVMRLKNFQVLEFGPGNSSAGLNPLFKKTFG